MPNLTRRTLIACLFFVGWAFAGSDRIPAVVWSNSPEPATERKPADLSSLKVFSKVIYYVKENYVDPKRVKPKEMMIAALEYVEKAVPEVLVDGSIETGKLRITVNGKSMEFDIGDVESAWKMNFRLKEVFAFISKNLRPSEDARDIEYAAINGMLSTLDPHSVLLRPELYSEMKLTTRGEFGGLGFVIQMREGNLSVVKVLPKTPAFAAGIKKNDLIRKIGEESTVNMDLNEAVGKLRGPVDTPVTITLDRKGWEKPQVMTLTRAMISIESVQSKLLAQNVGYVRLKNFQGNTTRDLQAALTNLGKQAQASGGMKGLVLDLRGNPGGLLEQAIQVSDQFLSSGTIVSTVGYSDKLREEKKARADDADNQMPMAVLVNAGSASASEIVAGALKNLNRAVIVGRQTFGKGSVQVLYDFPDDSALKLTIAKYLTPGDISIQETGIMPDIVLIPTRVTKDRVDLFAPRKSVGEADLDHHFGNPGADAVAKKRDDVVNRQKPSAELKFLKDEPPPLETAARPKGLEEGKPSKSVKPTDKSRTKPDRHPLLDTPEAAPREEDLDDQLDAETVDEIKEDFEVLFARDLVLKAPVAERERMLKASLTFVEEKRRQEEDRIKGAIEALGINWSAGPSPKSPKLISVLRPGPDARLGAGEPVELELSVDNQGSETVRRLRAWTESDNPYLDRREFLFGSLAPGEKRIWKVPVKLPKDLTSQWDEVSVRLADDTGPVGDRLASELDFVELPRPAFGFRWQVVDDCPTCNGDGLAQRGEDIELWVDVTNAGQGRTQAAFATIKNAADSNIFIERGRFALGEMAPGETKTARFALEVKRAYKEAPSFGLKLAIIDEPLEEYVTEKLQVPVGSAAVEFRPRKTPLRLAEDTSLLGAASAEAPVLARLPKGATLQAVAHSPSFWKVELDKSRHAFVRLAEGKEAPSARPSVPKDVDFALDRSPPHIALSIDPSTGGTATVDGKFTLSGTVSSMKSLLDMYVLVNDQKVFFKGAGPDDKAGLAFQTEFALKEGNNSVLVVARGTPDYGARKLLVIRRRPPAVAQKATEAIAH